MYGHKGHLAWRCVQGKQGRLRGRTFSAPRKWARGKGRITCQFGCCYNYAIDSGGRKPGERLPFEFTSLPFAIRCLPFAFTSLLFPHKPAYCPASPSMQRCLRACKPIKLEQSFPTSLAGMNTPCTVIQITLALS